MEKLTLSHITSYFPYGLLVKANKSIWKCKGINSLSIVQLERRHGHKLHHGPWLIEDKNFKPLLRPISDIVKEIEHEGEKFVPLKKLFILYETNQFDREEMLKLDMKKMAETIISCQHKTYTSGFKEDFILKYLISTSNMGDIVYSFTYDPDLSRFAHRDESHSKPLCTAHQLKLFQLLFEWKLDVFGLIPKDLAFDVNKLPKNPYN